MDWDHVHTVQQYLIGLAADYGPRFFSAILILVVGLFLSRRLRTVLASALQRGKMDQALSSFLSQLSYYVLLVLILIMAASQAGVQTASLLALVGTAGLAIGLALKDYLSNFAAGVMLFVTRPFHIDHWIEVNGAAGKVAAITMFQTTLITGDNRKIFIPNSKVMNGEIVNVNAHKSRRLDLIIGVSYEESIPKVKEVLQDIVSKQDGVLADPKPVIGVTEFGDSSIDLVVRPWVKTEDYWPVRFALLEAIKKRFDEENITIPFPQYSVHMEKSRKSPSSKEGL